MGFNEQNQLFPTTYQQDSSPGEGEEDMSYENEEDESEVSFGENIDRKIAKIKQNLRDDTVKQDDSMSKLNEVLMRQKQRLQGMGSKMGKNGENLEQAFKDLEKDIQAIKQNLDASRDRRREEYSPQSAGQESEFEQSNPEHELQPKFD